MLASTVGGRANALRHRSALVNVSATTLAARKLLRRDLRSVESERSTRIGSYRRTIVLSRDPVITAEDTAVTTRNVRLRGSDAQLTTRNNVVPASIAPGSYFLGIILEPDRDANMSDNFSAGIPVTVTPAARLTPEAPRAVSIEEAGLTSDDVGAGADLATAP